MTNQELEIILVEDNANDIELILRAFKRNDFKNKVTVLRDGAEAIEYILGKGKFAENNTQDIAKVVFLDLRLPKVDGLDVLKAIKTDEKMKVIPVVVLTSSNAEKDIAESYRLGANSYLVKPLDFEKFTRLASVAQSYWLMVNHHPS